MYETTICDIVGVADQLQTNYASDLRHILKCVFECNADSPYATVPAAVESAHVDETAVQEDAQSIVSHEEAVEAEEEDEISEQSEPSPTHEPSGGANTQEPGTNGGKLTLINLC